MRAARPRVARPLGPVRGPCPPLLTVGLEGHLPLCSSSLAVRHGWARAGVRARGWWVPGAHCLPARLPARLTWTARSSAGGLQASKACAARHRPIMHFALCVFLPPRAKLLSAATTCACLMRPGCLGQGDAGWARVPAQVPSCARSWQHSSTTTHSSTTAPTHSSCSTTLPLRAGPRTPARLLAARRERASLGLRRVPPLAASSPGHTSKAPPLARCAECSQCHRHAASSRTKC